jgi:hypothetical protein
MLELLEWYNLIFVLPFIMGVLYLGLLSVGLGGEHEIHAEMDMDHDVDLGGDLHHGIEHSTEVHAHGADHDHNVFVKALSFLGVGRVPISLVFMSFCFIWGTAGYLGNQFFGGILRYPGIFIWPSLALAGGGSVFGTRWLARLLGRIMPSTETYATSPAQLVGMTAEVLYSTSAIFGRARLHDSYGNIQDVSVRVAADEDSIPVGSKVILLRFDATEQAFMVRRDTLANEQLARVN